MKSVILDTNFVVQCLANKVDLFAELDRICDFPYIVAMIDRSLPELDKVAREGKPNERLGARIAKQLIAKKHIVLLKTTKAKHVDALILDRADKDTVVATQDKELKQKLKKKKIPVIVIRQMKYLEFQAT